MLLNKQNYIIPHWPAPANVLTCITTRKGGHSPPPYQENNLGLHVGDDAGNVQQNRMEVYNALGLIKVPQWLEQIHGVKVIKAKDDGLVRTADGSYTNEPDQACVVMTADCLPILLCDKKGTQVAAIHCGWRSLAKGIVFRALHKFNCSPESVLAYFGPAISQTHFEVGIDVLEAFFKASRDLKHTEHIAAAFKPALRPLHFYADIYALARAELNALGVAQIYGGDACTYGDSERFYSYRRDGVTGRMASLIWLASH
ncbi:MAG: peptidoglycan editing factor PgeF [Pseudomonadota bacterium]